MNISNLLRDYKEFPGQLTNVLSSRQRQEMPTKGLKKSAVLLPLSFKNAEFAVLLTRRSMNVEYHKGENSFPGGSLETADKSPEETAIREAHEEIGLDPEDVHVLGKLDDHITLVGFHTVPVVGLIPYPYKFVTHIETDALFYVSLEYTTKNGSWQGEQYTLGGFSTTVYYLETQGGVIWGATARILKHLADLIAGRIIPFSPLSKKAREWIGNTMADQSTYPK